MLNALQLQREPLASSGMHVSAVLILEQASKSPPLSAIHTCTSRFFVFLVSARSRLLTVATVWDDTPRRGGYPLRTTGPLTLHLNPSLSEFLFSTHLAAFGKAGGEGGCDGGAAVDERQQQQQQPQDQWQRFCSWRHGRRRGYPSA